MGKKRIETIINEKIYPFELNEKGKSNLAQLTNNYSYELLVECINIGVSQYFQYSEDGKLLEDSVNTFLDKLGGIAYNKTLTPIDQEINRINNKGKIEIYDWNNQLANSTLNSYISALRSATWTDEQIYNALKTEVIALTNKSHSWSEWLSNMEEWIDDIHGWDATDDINICLLYTSPSPRDCS